jgi:hypothetical protein
VTDGTGYNEEARGFKVGVGGLEVLVPDVRQHLVVLHESVVVRMDPASTGHVGSEGVLYLFLLS